MKYEKKYHPQIQQYTLKDGTVKYRFTVYLGTDPNTGKGVSITRSKFNSPKEAHLAIDKLKYEFKIGKNPENTRKTFNDVYLEWDSDYKESGIKMSTYSKTEGYFKNHILPYFGEMKVAKINVRHIEEFAISLSKKLKYFHHILEYTKDVLDTAVRYDYIHSNPFYKIKKYPRESKHITTDTYLETDELKKLLDYVFEVDFESYTLLRVLSFTGIRKGEMRILTWSDVDFDKKELKIFGTYSYSKHNLGKNISTTKTHEDRVILLDDVTIEVLKQWKEKQLVRLKMLGLRPKEDKNQLIFSNTKNNIVKDNFANTILNKYLQQLNMKHMVVHGLRHTHATHLLEAEAQLEGRKHRLGHSLGKNVTEKHYTHITGKIRENTLEKYIAYLNSKGIY